MNAPAPESRAGRELSVSRVIDAPPAVVFAAWAEHLPEWWGPHGMTTPQWEMDLRAGGIFRTVLRAPDGREYSTRGVFLEVVPGERIVFSDAFDAGWRPHADAFFTAVVTLAALPGGATRFTVRALHWTEANRDRHERMGFRQGWDESIERLTRCVARMAAHSPS